MNHLRHFLLCCALILLPAAAFCQQNRSKNEAVPSPAGISWQDWAKMNKRWQPYATRLNIEKKDGSRMEGQLVWMSDSLILVRKGFDLPEGNLNPEQLAGVPVKDIASMQVRLGGHPYQGMIYGILIGVIPGFVAGAIMAQGWTIIPAIVLGAVTAGGGGAVGNVIQKAVRKDIIEINAGNINGRDLKKMQKTAIFPGQLPLLPNHPENSDLNDFEKLVELSPTLQKAFPVKPWSLSLHSSLLTNSVRKRLQNWYLEPIWGPPQHYYETRIGLELDVSRRIGKQFEAGALFQMFPGDISSSFMDKYLPDYDVSYSYNHHFKQTTFGIYGGWKMHPAGRFWADRLDASVQVGALLSDVYEHFYFNWTRISDYTRQGETFIQQHNLEPGAMLRLQGSWHLIPGFSVDAGIEGFLVKRLRFEQRTVLPETAYGPLYLPLGVLNFSNVQAFLGFSVHL